MPCKGIDFQWVRIPPGNWSFQPVAVGATAEVTKSLKYFDVNGSLLGDLASMQAVTRVNAEQASKSATQEPTRRKFGEGCHHWTR